MTIGGRWYAPKCVIPGVTAWGHSISINDKQQFVKKEQLQKETCWLLSHGIIVQHDWSNWSLCLWADNWNFDSSLRFLPSCGWNLAWIKSNAINTWLGPIVNHQDQSSRSRIIDRGSGSIGSRIWKWNLVWIKSNGSWAGGGNPIANGPFNRNCLISTKWNVTFLYQCIFKWSPPWKKPSNRMSALKSLNVFKSSELVYHTFVRESQERYHY